MTGVRTAKGLVMNDEQMDLDSGPTLYLREETNDEWYVHITHLDSDPAEECLVCIGSGETREAAVADAVRTLTEAITSLRGPTPAQMEETLRNVEGKAE
jgi:hypothetical protein